MLKCVAQSNVLKVSIAFAKKGLFRKRGCDSKHFL